MSKDAQGMKGYRPRNEDGELRRKRGDTHVETVEKEYGVDLNIRGDAHLDTVLKREKVDSLDQLLQKIRDEN